MRKFIWFLIAISFFCSCKKMNSEIIENHSTGEPINVRVENNRLVFKTIQDCERLINTEPQTRKEIIDNLEARFTSYREKRLASVQGERRDTSCEVPEEVVEENDVFFSLFDENGIMKMGEDIFRFSYCDQKMYIISDEAASDQSLYEKFMSGDISDTNVRWFPSYVDGFEALEGGIRTMPDSLSIPQDETFEKGPPGFSPEEHMLFDDYEYTEPDAINNVKLRGKLAYDKFFIYFHLYGNEKYQVTAVFPAWVTSNHGTRDWWVDYDYKYKKKRNGTTYSGSGTLYPPLSGENKNNKNVYEGSTGLEKLKVRWDVTVHTDQTKVYRGGNYPVYIGEFFIYVPLAYANNYTYNYYANSNPPQYPYTSPFIINSGY